MDQRNDQEIKDEIMNSAPTQPGVIASGPVPEKKPNFFKTKSGKILLAVIGGIVVFGAGIGATLIIVNSNSSNTATNKNSSDERSKERSRGASENNTAKSGGSSGDSEEVALNATTQTENSSTEEQAATEFGVANGYLNIPQWGIRIAIPDGFNISYRMEGDNVYVSGYSAKRGARPAYADIEKNPSGLGAISFHRNKNEKVMYADPVFEAPDGMIYSSGSQAYFSTNDADKNAEVEDRDIVINMLTNNIRFLTNPY